MLHKARKPNGTVVEVNNDMLPHLPKLGWDLIEEKAEDENLKPKRTRRPKVTKS